MSTPDSEPRDPEGAAQPTPEPAVGKPEDASGLHDIRALAQTTIERHVERCASDAGEVAEALLVSASPAALGRVLLPTPAMGVPAGPSPTPWLAIVGAAAGAALIGLVAIVYLNRPAPLAISGGRPGPAAQFAVKAGAATPAAKDEPSVEDRPAAAEPAAREAAPLAKDSDKDKIAPAAPTAKTAEPATAATAEKKDAKGQKPAEVPAKVGDRETAAAKPAKEHQAEPELDSLLDEAAGAPKRDNVAKADKKEAEKKEAQAKASEGELVPATLSREEVKKGMAMVRAKVQVCYDKFKVAGTITIRLKIESSGAVAGADAIDAKFRGTETGLCVADAVQNARFSRFSGPPMTINYPFKLE